MEIKFTLNDKTVQSYLDHYNEINGTKLSVKTLTPKQEAKIAKVFADLSRGEIHMRTDDHDGFETDQSFGKL